MHHRNAPLTVVGRQRAIAQVVEVGRPIAHVAAEFHIARTTLSKWVGRFREHGELGLQDHSSAPANRPTRLPIWVLELIESWRRTKKWSARRIARELADGHGFRCCVRTVSRWLDRLGLNRIRDITPDGENLRRPGKIIARYPGHMVHMDVKKVGKIPDGGGWWAHGRGSEQALAGKRAHKQKVGYTYLHSIIDGFSRLAYTEALEDETAATTIAFFHRARVFFAAHGITRITRLITDNGANYTSKAFHRSTCAFIRRHQRTRIYTPRHNGKIERYQRLLTDECLYARAYESETARRETIEVWVHHYDYHRPHTACGDQPPASRLHAGVDNVMTNYTYGVSWWLVQAALAAAAVILPDVDDVRVTRLGVDEHRYRSVRWFRTDQGAWRRFEPWMTTLVDLATGQVLGIVDGRDSRSVGDWLAQRSEDWRERIEIVAIDPSAAFRKALRTYLPRAAVSVDKFHLVKLGNDMVTTVRQRLARTLRGRRGRKDDPAWAHRMLLLRGADTLTPRAWERLEAVFRTDDPTDELSAAWGIKEALPGSW